MIGRTKLRFGNVLKRDLDGCGIAAISKEKYASNKKEWKCAVDPEKT